MNEPKRADDALAFGPPVPIAPASDDPVSAVPLGTLSTSPGPASVSESETALSAEEQMERFARDLQENDWGHQPC